MTIPEYLRRQAERCLHIARTGFDLGTAQRLRILADDLYRKADETEQSQLRRDRPSRQGGPSIRRGQQPDLR